jgi:excisionase family DNA binding protein
MSLRVIKGGQATEAFVDRKEMARQLGVSIATLDRMVRADEIPSCTFNRRTRRFRPSVVIAAVEALERRAKTEDAA